MRTLEELENAASKLNNDSPFVRFSEVLDVVASDSRFAYRKGDIARLVTAVWNAAEHQGSMNPHA